MDKEANLRWRAGLPVGWHALFGRLVAEIERENPEAIIRDAKEKFGSLRVYLNRLSPEIEELIDDASRRSARTCQKCGEPAQLLVSADGWYATLCDEHRGGSTQPTQDPVLASLRVYGDGSIRKIDRS